MSKLFIIAVLMAGGVLFIWNTPSALAKVCSSIDLVQNQFPLEYVEARALSLLK